MSESQKTFIDLFAGIGGFHLAFTNAGAKCVYASEWDDYARRTYQANWEKTDPHLFPDFFAGDITQVDKTTIPDHDILTGGFPCQPFSHAGFRKGFEDTRGTLFYEIAEILEEKKPQAYFLENVRGLLNHDGGKTFTVVRRTLNDLGYSTWWKVVKASDFGLPQHRPRLFLIGFRDPSKTEWFENNLPLPTPLNLTMSNVFGTPMMRDVGFTLRVGGRGSGVADRRNWDCYLTESGEEMRLGVEEGKRMMGLPESFVFPVSETQAMKQLGNSVAVPAVQAYAEKIVEALQFK